MASNLVKISIDLPDFLIEDIEKAALRNGRKRNPFLRELLVKYLPLILIDSEELNSELSKMIERSVQKNMEHFTSRIAKLIFTNLAETNANIEYVKFFLKNVRNEENLEEIENASLLKYQEDYEWFIENIQKYSKKGD